MRQAETEESTRYTIRIRAGHLKKVLGASLDAHSLAREELTTLSGVWTWAVADGLVGPLPNKGLRYPKSIEKSPFKVVYAEEPFEAFVPTALPPISPEWSPVAHLRGYQHPRSIVLRRTQGYASGGDVRGDTYGGPRRNQGLSKEKSMTNVAVIIGSTRPGRVGEAVGKWVFEIARRRQDAQFELVDLADYKLPLLDEPVPPSMGRYSKEHTKRWAAKIASFDAYVFVTAEYNHGIPGALKNAVDFLFAEWNNKAAGFVSYGSAGGARAVEQLRLVLAEVQIATVRNQVMLNLFSDFENFTQFKPHPRHEDSVGKMLDQLIAWGGALQQLRTSAGSQ